MFWTLLSSVCLGKAAAVQSEGAAALYVTTVRSAARREEERPGDSPEAHCVPQQIITPLKRKILSETELLPP